VAISRQKKEELVAEYVQQLNESDAIFLASYSGLSVGEMEKVRSAMRQEETRLQVIRNRLFTLAAHEAGRESVAAMLMGPTLAVFCKGDPSSPAKTLSDLGKEYEALQVYGGIVGDSLLQAEEFEAVANLPPRDVLLSQVIAGMQAPISGLAGVLSGILRSVLYVLQARADQLEGAGAAEAA